MTSSLLRKDNIITGFNDAYIVALLSAILFYINNLYVLKHLVPYSVRISAHLEFKWRNISNSWIHAIITSCGAVFCLYQHPEFQKDWIYKWTLSSHYTLALSTGYFVYDIIDMAKDQKQIPYDLIVHHILIIACFVTAVSTCMFEGIGIVALLVEVNGVFLHTRNIMNIHQTDRGTLSYRLVAFLNVATFVTFRAGALFWMSWWMMVHREQVSTFVLCLTFVSLSITTTLNVFLLLQIIRTDYFHSPGQELEEVIAQDRKTE